MTPDLDAWLAENSARRASPTAIPCDASSTPGPAPQAHSLGLRWDWMAAAVGVGCGGAAVVLMGMWMAGVL